MGESSRTVFPGGQQISLYKTGYASARTEDSHANILTSALTDEEAGKAFEAAASIQQTKLNE
jgi:hypothetical protein